MIITIEEVKAYLEITDTNKDILINLQIPYVENWLKDYLHNSFIDSEGNDLYPQGIKYPVALMIKYDLYFRNSKELGVSSKSLGDSSKSFESNLTPYPIEIIQLLEPYRQSVRFN